MDEEPIEETLELRLDFEKYLDGMPSYKKIGILGGMGPEASASLYLRIIRLFQKQFGAILDEDYPEMVFVNLPLPDVVSNEDNSYEVEQCLLRGLKTLEIAGVDFIAIACNTVSFFLPKLRKEIGIPIISIVEEVANVVNALNLQKVGILGTEMTLSTGLYNSALKNIELIGLGIEDRKLITSIILRVLAGKKERDDRVLLGNVINQLISRGAQKVILGCTELPILMEANDFVIDSLQILAKSIVKIASGEENVQ